MKGIVVSHYGGRIMKNKLTKSQKKLAKVDQDVRAHAFHLFKGHKKEFEECTPCKHVKYFMEYELLHTNINKNKFPQNGDFPPIEKPPSSVFFKAPQSAPTIGPITGDTITTAVGGTNVVWNDNSAAALKGEYVYDDTNSTITFGTTNLGEVGTELTQEHLKNAAAKLKKYSPSMYTGSYKSPNAMTIDPKHKIIVAKASEHLVIHSSIKSLTFKEKSDSEYYEPTYTTCTTNFKPPKISSWKSHAHLCECGQVTIKWIP
jgi:hypothetical protein